jgi:hypothetical protein
MVIYDRPAAISLLRDLFALVLLLQVEATSSINAEARECVVWGEGGLEDAKGGGTLLAGGEAPMEPRLEPRQIPALPRYAFGVDPPSVTEPAPKAVGTAQLV